MAKNNSDETVVTDDAQKKKRRKRRIGEIFGAIFDWMHVISQIFVGLAVLIVIGAIVWVVLALNDVGIIDLGHAWNRLTSKYDFDSEYIGNARTDYFLLNMKQKNQNYEKGLEQWAILNYEQAELYLIKARDEVGADKSQGSVEAAKVNIALGCLYLDLGRYEESYDLLNSAYIAFKDKYGVKDDFTHVAKINIAIYDIAIGEVERGIDGLYETYNATKKIPVKLDIARTLIDTYRRAGNYGKASEWFQMVSQINQVFEAVLDTPLVKDGLTMGLSNEAGLLCQQFGYYQQALAYYETAISIWEESGGGISLTLANIYDNMSHTCASLSKAEDAVMYADMALELREQLIPQGHPALGMAYNNRAVMYENLGLPDKQIEYLNKALEIYLNTVGENHESTAYVYVNIGRYYWGIDNIDEAIKYHERALSIRQGNLLKYHPDTAKIYNDLSDLYFEAERYADVIDSAQEAIKIYQIFDDLYQFGSSSPVENAYFNAGMAYYKLADYDNSLLNYASCKNLREKRLEIEMSKTDLWYEPDFVPLGVLYNNIAAVYEDMGDYTIAADFELAAYAVFIQNDIDITGQEKMMNRLHRLYEHLDPAESFENWITPK